MSAALWKIVVPREVVVVEAAACICTCARVRPVGRSVAGVPASCEADVVLAVGMGGTPAAMCAGLGLCRVCVDAVGLACVWRVCGAVVVTPDLTIGLVIAGVVVVVAVAAVVALGLVELGGGGGGVQLLLRL